MYSKVNTAILSGIDSTIVCVETDISEGMPMFLMVGYLSSEVKEAKDRVRTALKNLGIHIPPKRITVNISPASIRKSGTGFDLPLAVSVLAAMGIILNVPNDMIFIGEMGLNGILHPIDGVLPMVMAAKESGIKTCVVSVKNVDEATLVPGMNIIGIDNLEEIIPLLNEGKLPTIKRKPKRIKVTGPKYNDFSNINGMLFLRRACEVAVSGFHNMLMIGPPGSGKTFISKALPSIMPPLNEEEQLEISKIYSVCGIFGQRHELINERPFRSPHHTISDVGLAGGGANPHPGEISLAHKGILFLDELLEFRRSTIEILRQPLEEGKVNIVRIQGDYTFPADFMLIAAMNPCPCGYFPDSKCTCTPRQVSSYLSKLSRPLTDRIDICVDVPKVEYNDIIGKGHNESSADIRARVMRVIAIQAERYKGEDFSYNYQIPSGLIDKYCSIGKTESDYIRENFEGLSLTARSYHKLLKVARTIADMAGKEQIDVSDLREAVCYRINEGEGAYGKI